MNKKLPGIYKGNDYSHVNNNKKIFYSGNKEQIIENDNINNKSYINEYTLNTPVIIETYDDNVIKTKIVSKRNDHILTSDNKIIKTSNIKSIKTIYKL